MLLEKLFRFTLILIIVFLAICQINKFVSAYTQDEWKELIEYKEVAVDR